MERCCPSDREIAGSGATWKRVDHGGASTDVVGIGGLRGGLSLVEGLVSGLWVPLPQIWRAGPALVFLSLD